MSAYEIALILAFIGTLAGFVDSIVGGGGLISVPAVLLTGLPPATALGSNKLGSVFGAFTAMINYARHGAVSWDVVGRLVPLAFCGSLGGAALVMWLSPTYVKPIVIALLIAVLLFTIFKRDWGEVNTFHKGGYKQQVILVTMAFGIGLYDGFIGPGTGTFLTIAFLLLGFDFLQAAGNTKVLNFITNITALGLFLTMEQIDILYGLSMAVGQVIGAFLGSRFALTGGTRLVRLLLIVVTAGMLIKLVYDYTLSGALG